MGKPLPTMTLAKDAFPDPDRLSRHFQGRAELRFEDISTPEAVRAATVGADVIIVMTHRLTGEILAAMDRQVRVIGRAGVGLDAIDIEAAKALGVTVFNEPDYGVSEVASHAVGLMLALHRKFQASDSFVREGWTGRVKFGPMKPVDELVVGLLGYGRIGRRVATYLESMVERVVVYDPYVTEVPAAVTRVETLRDLLTRSDVVSLHVPRTEETVGLLGREELALLPENAILVNVARGGLVDEEALSELLAVRHLAGAGLDVFADEPLPPDAAILRAPNTLLTPHSAALSDRAMWRLGWWTVSDAIEWLGSRSLTYGSLVLDGAASASASGGRAW